MAGRKPVNDDRQKCAVVTYLTEEELNRLNEQIKHESKAWFVRRILMNYLDGRLVQKENELCIPNDYSSADIELCKEFIQNKPNLKLYESFKKNCFILPPNKMIDKDIKIINDILSDDNKRTQLINMIYDSKFLSGEN